MEFDRRAYADLFKIALAENRLKKSSDTFKIKLFLDKAENVGKQALEFHVIVNNPEAFWRWVFNGI